MGMAPEMIHGVTTLATDLGTYVDSFCKVRR